MEGIRNFQELIDDDDGGEINGYVIHFFEHLRKEASHRRDFLVFYRHWEPMRLSTIANLRKLKNTLHDSEAVCNVGLIAARGTGFGGALSQFLSLLRVISPAAKNIGSIVSAVGHGVATGISVAKTAIIERSRKEVKRSINRDINNTNRLWEIGLHYQGVLRELEDIIRKLEKHSFSYAVDRIGKAIESLSLGENARGRLGPNIHRNAAQQLLELSVREGEVVTAVANLLQPVNKYFRHNPDARGIITSLAQTGNDLHGQFLANGTFNDSSCHDFFYGTGLAFSMFEDAREISRVFVELKHGTSTTEYDIDRALERLEKEYGYLQDIYGMLCAVDQ